MKLIKVLTVLSLVVTLTACSSEKNDAKKAFETAVSELQQKEEKLNDYIDELQKVVDSGEVPLEGSLLEEADQLIESVNGAIFEVPEMAKEVNDIKAQTDKITAISYQNEMDELQQLTNKLTTSIQQMKQVTNPTEDFVIERITGLDGVGDIAPVTEDNDPNGNLHKPGGYTATIYFASPLVDHSYLTNDVIEDGTRGGGAIEVYETVELADKRNTYLSAFDGSILSNGSHEVCGTCVIRTSDELTATQQKDLTKVIKEALIEIK